MTKRSASRNENGQAVAEFAAVLPLFVLLMMLIIQVGVVLFQQLALENAAREGARSAAVDSSPEAARRSALSATKLPDSRMEVKVGPRPDAEGMVRVDVRFEARVIEPLSGAVLLRPQLKAGAAMRVEDNKSLE